MNMNKFTLYVVLLTFLLSGCTFTANMRGSASKTIYSSHEDTSHRKYLNYEDSEVSVCHNGYWGYRNKFLWEFYQYSELIYIAELMHH